MNTKIDLSNVENIENLALMQENSKFQQKTAGEEFKKNIEKQMNDPKEILKMKLKIKKQQRSKKLTDKQIQNLKKSKKKSKKNKQPPPKLN